MRTSAFALMVWTFSLAVFFGNADQASAQDCSDEWWSSCQDYNRPVPLMDYVPQYLGTYDRGCKTANFYVIRETDMPATLSECAFVDHAGDGAILDNPDMRQAAARAHLHALQAHYGFDPCDPGTVEPFPLMELDVQVDAIDGQEPDFCTQGDSQDIFDITAGQSTFPLAPRK